MRGASAGAVTWAALILLGCGGDREKAPTGLAEPDVGDLPVALADSALEAVVREVVGLPNGVLTAAALDTVTKLTARERGIADLAGIGSLFRLEILDLADNAIEDLAPPLNARGRRCGRRGPPGRRAPGWPRGVGRSTDGGRRTGAHRIP